MKKKNALIFAGILLLAACAWADDRVTVTGLSGKLASYGRYGYGEDFEEDDIELYRVLIPDTGFEFFDDDSRMGGFAPAGNPVQLVLPSGIGGLKPRCRYRITGSPVVAATGHHHSDVLIFVASVEVLRGENERHLHTDWQD